MNKKLLFLLLVAGIFISSSALAAGPACGPSNYIILVFNNLLYMVIWPVFLGIAILAFIWSGVLYIAGRGEPAKINLANQGVLVGVAGIAIVLLSFVLMNMLPALGLGCVPVPIPPATAACCDDLSAACTLQTPAFCSTIGGHTPLAVGTTCNPNPCRVAP